jgi:phage shock protein E
MLLRRFAFVVALISGLLAACSAPSLVPAAAPVATPVAAGDSRYSNITPAQLAEMLKSKDFFLVNVHIPYAGEITATDAFIPYNQTAQQLGQYPASPQAKIVVYCRSGRMSAIAAAELVKAGYTNVWNLEGGMSAWEQAGYPLLQK